MTETNSLPSRTAHSGAAPVAQTENGVVRGVAAGGSYAYLGLPYASPPTGRLRWRAPQSASDWTGARDATGFGPSCPQPPSASMPAGPTSEDCLYLNVYTPEGGEQPADRDARLPVLVWIHGGRFSEGAGRSFEPMKLVAEGMVVVTINYRLGPFGFFSHPALASRPGGPSGNYGLMDQQAALQWVQRNIREFGGNPHNVTIAGQSAGGLSVLAHMVSRHSRGLFHKAIVQSGAFALTQQPLAEAEASGEQIATKAGCALQTADRLRELPVDVLLDCSPPFAIPGVVDGHFLKESIGTALAARRFARVPVLNGSNHDEERIFVAENTPVSRGTFVRSEPVTAQNYRQVIASTLGVSDARATAIADEYPTAAYASPTGAFSTLLNDTNFALNTLQVNEWTSSRVPTFAYEFDDDGAPLLFGDLDPPVATHLSELQYLFDLPDTPVQVPLDRDQEMLARRMRAAWANFAANGDPSTDLMPWPSFARGALMTLVSPRPRVDSKFAARHHRAFWSAA